MKKKMIGIVVVIVLVTTFLCGYKKINDQFPPTKEIWIAMGETTEFQEGILITINHKRILTDKEKEVVYEKRGEEPLMDLKILEVEATLENTTDQNQEVALYNMEMETLGMLNGVRDVLVDLQDDVQITVQKLNPKESRKVIVQYEIISSMFSKKEWSTIEDRKFWLTYTLYPEKRMLMLE